MRENLCLNYNIPLWLQNNDSFLTLENFFPEGTIIFMRLPYDNKKKIEGIGKMNKHFELSLQMLLPSTAKLRIFGHYGLYKIVKDRNNKMRKLKPIQLINF